MRTWSLIALLTLTLIGSAQAQSTLTIEGQAMSSDTLLNGSNVNLFQLGLGSVPYFSYWQLASGFNEMYIGPRWPFMPGAEVGLGAGLSETSTTVRYRLGGYLSYNIGRLSTITIVEHGPADTWYRSTGDLMVISSPWGSLYNLGWMSQTGYGTGPRFMVNLPRHKFRFYEAGLFRDKDLTGMAAFQVDF